MLCNLTLDENNDYGKGREHIKQPFEMLEKLWSDMLHDVKITQVNLLFRGPCENVDVLCGCFICFQHEHPPNC